MRNLKSYVKVMLVNIFGQAKVNTSEVAFIAESSMGKQNYVK